MIPDISFIWTFLLTKTLVVVQLLIHTNFHVLCAGIQIRVPDSENSNPITSLRNKYCCLLCITLSFSIYTYILQPLNKIRSAALTCCLLEASQLYLLLSLCAYTLHYLIACKNIFSFCPDIKY